MSPIKMLDKVLYWFSVDIAEIKGGHIVPRQSVRKDEALKNMTNIHKELDTVAFLDYQDLILDKLEKDGYIKSVDGLYSITFEGKLFNSIGGYAAKHKLDADNAETIRRDLISRKKNDHRLVLATFLAGIGALVLVVWDIYKTFYLKR